ncbi:MAG: ATP-grasp domain-containing protein [Promethearchaeota archaeon]
MKSKLIFFSYATIDFIIDENLNLYFLEANDLADGLYALETIRRYLIKNYPTLIVGFKNIFFEFVKMFKENYKIYSNGDTLKRVAIIYHNKYRKTAQRDELIEIKKTFILNGIDCEIYLPEELYIEDGFLIDIKNLFIPQMIFRRTSKLPLNINGQLIINDPRVRYITANKYFTYNLIFKYSKKINLLINQPQTILVDNFYNIEKEIEVFIQRFKPDILVIKPVWLWGGQGVIFAKDLNDAKVKFKKYKDLINPKFINYSTPLLIQNFINSYKFLNYDNNEYIFEIRAFLFNYNVVGLIGRIPKNPFNINNLDRQSLLCNISGGGKWLPILIDTNENNENIKVKKILKDNEIIFEEPINPIALILPKSLFVKISDFSKKIALIISEKVLDIDEERLSSIPF